MVKVVHDVRPLKLTIIIVCVHLFCHRLIQVRVEVAKERTTLLRTKVEHKDKPAHIDDCCCHDKAVSALHGGTQAIFWIRLQVVKGQDKDDHGVDASPDIRLLYLATLFCVLWQRLQVVVGEAIKPDVGERADKHYLNVVWDVRDKRGHCSI